MHSGGDGGEWGWSQDTVQKEVDRPCSGRMGIEGKKSIKDDAQVFIGSSEWVVVPELTEAERCLHSF